LDGASQGALDNRIRDLAAAAAAGRTLRRGSASAGATTFARLREHGPFAPIFTVLGHAAGPVQGGIKGCRASDEESGRAAMHWLWPNDSVPGEAAQLLPLPRHFEQVSELVTEDMITAPCGPDPRPYIEAIGAYQEAGFDETYLGQVGGRLEGAFEFYATGLLPRVRER
jgi:hypothetical protein